MKGSVFKRCPCGVTGGGGKRKPACKKDHGSWSYVADLEPGPDGKRQQEKRGGFPDRDSAEEALAAVLKGVSDGTYAHDGGITVGRFLDDWLAGKIKAGLRPTTVRSYRQHIEDYIKPVIGKIRMRDLRPGHVAALLAKVNAAAATVRRVHATLRSALGTALRLQLIGSNVAAAVNKDLPAATRPKVRPWEPAELGKFLDHAVTDERFGSLLELIAATGLRRGEAAGLRWADIDLEAGVLTVEQQLVEVHTKTGGQLPPCPYCTETHTGLMFGPVKTSSSESTVELDSGAVGVLLSQQIRQQAERDEWGTAYKDHDLVFAREDGTPISPDTVTKRFKALCREVGVRLVRLHDLRHGAASLRLASGADISIVSKVLRHSSIRITSDTYSHLLEGVGKQAAEKAAALVPRSRRDQSVTTQAKTAAPEAPVTAVKAGQDRGAGRDRTDDRRIMSRQDAVSEDDG